MSKKIDEDENENDNEFDNIIIEKLKTIILSSNNEKIVLDSIKTYYTVLEKIIENEDEYETVTQLIVMPKDMSTPRNE